MPHHLSDDRNGHPGVEQVRAVGVPGVVQPHLRHSGGPGQPLEGVAVPTRRHEPPERVDGDVSLNATQLDPAASRSSRCRARWSPRAATASGDSGTMRRPAALLVLSCTTATPPTMTTTEVPDVLDRLERLLGLARGTCAGAGAHVLLRDTRDGMAFEVVLCERGGVVWAGRVGDGRGARCEQSERVGLSVR